MFKGFLSEGGIRSPLIVAGSGVRQSGRISGAVAHITDIPATILDAAGVPHPETFEGRSIAPLQGNSLLPILHGEKTEIRNPDDWTGWELFGNRAIRQGDWKLLWLCKPFGPGRWQLFNLKDDPGETRDVSAEHADIRDQLTRHWSEYAEDNRVILPDVSPVCEGTSHND
jgi:arylsulfatase